MKKIAVLGSTGSIGTQTLAACEELGITVTALSAHKNAKLLEEQARKFHPKTVALTDKGAYDTLKITLADTDVRVLFGPQALLEIGESQESELLLNAVMGMVGLPSTLAALKAKKTVAIANKETLVAAGELVMKTARENGAAVLPVDSEHSAIFQCLGGHDNQRVRRIVLTASGGPFYQKTRDALLNVTVQEALCHPNWSMGQKITIDSATLMNKGLELIEAVWLFGVAPSQVEVHIHRESILHSGVEFWDGALLAQLGTPDMALPIRYALTYPQRAQSHAKALDLFSIGALTFARPDEATFGCLPLARGAILKGGLSPCVLNAANEAAVALFLEGKIRFLEIEELVGGALDTLPAPAYQTLDEVLACERAAREYVLSRR